MSKSLVLAEKPSVARDIARVLKATKKGDGYLEGKDYIITWALGHLVTLAAPEEYDKKYKTWNLEDLPIIPKENKLVVINETKKQYYAVKNQMARGDVDQIIIATDAGREGELVARWIIEKSNIRKPIKRLWISSVTDKAISDGFKNLKPGSAYENLFKAAIARSEADWVVGINATRALTVKYNSQLSCGRVQSPTLSMISKREDEIKSFKPKKYYGISIKSKDLSLTWQDKNNNTRNFDESQIDTIIKNIKGKELKVINLEKTLKKIYANGLYNLTELQRDANARYNFSAKETLSLMQNLYERHKVLTYPRTDSKYLSDDVVGTINDRLKSINVGDYKPLVAKVINKPIKANRSFVDGKKVTDHHAIIPTEQRVVLSELSFKEMKIYDLVVKRFLAVLYPAFEYEETKIIAKIGEEKFIARGKRVIKEGFKAVYSDSEEETDDDVRDQSLPLINKGDTLNVVNIQKTVGETKPPKYFTEGTLLMAMENPVKYMDEKDKEIASILHETGGIGTVATRADIMEKLYKTFLIENRGKDMLITGKGKQLLELTPEDLKSPDLTGEWERKLVLIEQGKLKKEKFIQEINDYSRKIIKEIKTSNLEFKHDNISRTKCPDCGKFMLEVKGKTKKMLVCQDRDCGSRITLSQTTNARCPNCKKKLELKGQGDAQMFTCKCGHREKMSSFNKRKKQQQNRLSKGEVNKFLNKQDKQEEPLNTSLADALSKLKL
nr:DNA topoisomerase III [Tissierella sp.]